MDYFIDPYGKKRLGTQVTCPACTKVFWTRADRLRKACSAICRGALRQSRVTCECAHCHKRFERTKSKTLQPKSGLHFCDRTCKDAAQRIGGVAAIMPPHYGTGGVDYRSLFTSEEMVCARCGYQEFDCSVDIHHIDEDRSNNNRENLIPLCGCCHKGLHNKRWGLEDIQGPRV